jgi:hypothetical protein
MRNKWFPMRIADYVPVAEVKQLKAQGVTIGRDTEFGVQVAVQEEPDADSELSYKQKHYVRPVEIDFLSVCTQLALLDSCF